MPRSALDDTSDDEDTHAASGDRPSDYHRSGAPRTVEGGKTSNKPTTSPSDEKQEDDLHLPELTWSTSPFEKVVSDSSAGAATRETAPKAKERSYIEQEYDRMVASGEVKVMKRTGR